MLPELNRMATAVAALAEFAETCSKSDGNITRTIGASFKVAARVAEAQQEVIFALAKRITELEKKSA